MEKTKRVLIISPYFIPFNTPDMQRVRMSLPYFKSLGWEAEVVAVDPKFSEFNQEPLLSQTIPTDIKIHYVKALSKVRTMKFGLGSIAIRSLKFYHKKVSELLSTKSFDLVYFSTTQYPVCVLGSIWKRKFRIPYIIDVQDPWHTDYYKNKPRAERPKKYWFSYRLNKYLEPMAMKNCDGLISVSKTYLDELTSRYPQLEQIPKSVITFGYSEIDQQTANKIIVQHDKNKGQFSLLYTGVLGSMMLRSLNVLFGALKQSLTFKDKFELKFVGTSYAPGKTAKKTAEPVFKKYDLQSNITEETNRIGLLETIRSLQNADGLVIIGTDDPAYTASKIYPYLQSRKPILAILHPDSVAYHFLKTVSNAIVIKLSASLEETSQQISEYLQRVMLKQALHLNESIFESFSAKRLTEKQVELFNAVDRAQYMH